MGIIGPELLKFSRICAKIKQITSIFLIMLYNFTIFLKEREGGYGEIYGDRRRLDDGQSLRPF